MTTHLKCDACGTAWTTVKDGDPAWSVCRDCPYRRVTVRDDEARAVLSKIVELIGPSKSAADIATADMEAHKTSREAAEIQWAKLSTLRAIQP